MLSLSKLTLNELCEKSVRKYRGRTAFEIYRDGCTYDRVTYREFGVLSRRFASLFMSLGVKIGDRVMLLSENRPEWGVAYFGAARAGAVVLPTLVEFASAQIRDIIAHASPSLICVSEKTAPKLIDAAGTTPVVFLDSIENMHKETASQRNEPDTSVKVSICGVEKRLPLRDRDVFPERGEDDMAVIIYTSGTLGISKGVMLSHRNLVWAAVAASHNMKVYPRDRCLSVIPLAHTYECVMGMITAVLSGSSVFFLDRPPSLTAFLGAIQELKPTALLTVPLFIEKICHSLINPDLHHSFLYRFPLTRYIAIRLAGRKLLNLFGGGLRFLGIGGAPLADDVEHFLRTAEFPYAPGYGLTEMSPLVSGTAPYRFPFRSAGRIVKGVEVRIVPIEGSADGIGEIQTRGPNLMLGYYCDEERTKAAFTEDGWFKTGDLGYIDKKNCLYIRGRLKNMILRPSGENIYPEEIEMLLLQSPLVEDALVSAGERGEIIARVFPREDAQKDGHLAEQLEELRRNVNARLAVFSRIDRLELQNEPFEKTPTGKIKRFLYT